MTETKEPITLHPDVEDALFGGPDTCARCGVVSVDCRTLWHACLYDMSETGIPFVPVILDEGGVTRTFYTLRVCNGCRADWLRSIQKWFETKPDTEVDDD